MMTLHSYASLLEGRVDEIWNGWGFRDDLTTQIGSHGDPASTWELPPRQGFATCHACIQGQIKSSRNRPI